MEYKVKIFIGSKETEIKAEGGSNLRELLKAHSINIDSPCGGLGTCGKCKVRITGMNEPPLEREYRLLGKEALDKGYRLACLNYVNSDLQIYIDDDMGEIVAATESINKEISINPLVKKEYVVLTKPDLNDQKSDLERLLAAGKGYGLSNDTPLEFLKDISSVLRESQYKVTIVRTGDRVTEVEPGDTTGRLYGIAVDIGTTTIAGYLLDLNTGKKLDVYSCSNPQKVYGADVISRIFHTITQETALDELQKIIIKCINEMIDCFTKNNGISCKDIYEAVFVGNTTMLHFLLGLPAKNIASSPFIPVTTAMHIIKPDDIGLGMNSGGRAVVFPSVAAYIGADTVSAVLTSGIHEKDEISLLIDLGTNGEIVLGCKNWLLSCSAAAGPAFEGANIQYGVAGVRGAIDKVELDGDIKYSTIGGGKAIGICGSGLVDAVSVMISSGIIDETGRFLEKEEQKNLSPKLRNRIVYTEGSVSFLIAAADGDRSDTDIFITQKDIRELQSAKAAIAAGVKVLVKNAGISVNDIDRVFLAGGFGSFINIESAIKIGLIPEGLKGKVQSIGNAAGAGAVEGLLSSDALIKASEIKNRIKYIELSASKDFMDEYINCMMF